MFFRGIKNLKLLFEDFPKTILQQNDTLGKLFGAMTCPGSTFQPFFVQTYIHNVLIMA